MAKTKKGGQRVFYIVRKIENLNRDEGYVLRVGRGNLPTVDKNEVVVCRENSEESPELIRRALDRLRRTARANNIPFVVNLDRR